jgi:DNA-binding LytR/AlgR family response regulator
MKPIECLIVDDEPLALNLLEKYVRQTPFLQLAGRCGSAFEAMEIMNDRPVDLLFLDIQMPDLSGLEFSRTLQNGPRVIFTTAFEQYALEGFKVDALDYLLKPFSYAEFLRAAQKAKAWFERAVAAAPATPGANYIFVKSEYRLVRIDLDEVLFMEGLKDYVKIHLAGHDKPVLSLMSLKALDEQLPAGQFMRVHRSFIVRLDKVETVEKGRIVFGRTYIPVADNYREKFQEFLNGRSLNS